MIIKTPFFGCESTPDKIVSALNNFNESGFPVTPKIASVGTKEELFTKAKNIFSTSEFPVFIGGGHAVTYHVMKALNAGIVIFDAHADCSAKFSTPEREDLLLELVKFIPANHIILVGLRRFFEGESNFLAKNKIKYYSMHEIMNEGINETCDAVMSVAKNFQSFYLSIDADVLDPAFVKTPYPEPGGFSARELLYFIRRLRLLKNLKGADITEILPEENSVRLGAKLVEELSR